MLTSRGAGWAVAAAMAGAVVGLSVAMATSSSPTIVVQPEGAAGLRGTPAGPVRAALPGGALQAPAPAVACRLRCPHDCGSRSRPGCGIQVPAAGPLQTPARLRIQVPAGGPLQAPARLRIQVPAAGPLQAPARLRIQVPAGGPLQAPARLRIQVPAAGPLQAPAQLRQLAQVPGQAGTLIPVPGAIQALPGGQVIAGIAGPRAIRLRVRPGQVRVRLRLPANGRLQVLPGGAVPGPLRVLNPGPRQASLVPAALAPPARARLRIAFRNGAPARARLLIPASLPGHARIRIQVPARARIQVPARAPITQAPPAPPNW